jgi:MoxR-like ATPase
MHEPGQAERRGARFWDDLRTEVGRAVVGQTAALRQIAVALLAHGHVLIEDVPGVGKTLLARAVAEALDLDFGRIQGTPDLLPSDITGTSILEAGSFRFVPGPVFTNILLVDEVNRATPRAQSALLEAMQERQVSIDGQTRALPSPFLVLATQNPIELEGTFVLPEAQLDRFILRVRLGYPDEAEERSIAGRYDAAPEPLDALHAVIAADRMAALVDEVRAIHVSADVEAYIVRLVRATRGHAAITLGASPRASVALHRASQAAAWLSGRAFVLPDDVQALYVPVIAHRLIVDVDRQLRGVQAEQILAEILAAVPAPPPAGASSS